MDSYERDITEVGYDLRKEVKTYSCYQTYSHAYE